MPINLIQPKAVDAGAAANDAWGISAVKADTSPFTGDGVLVAVLDTGIDKVHEAFTGVAIVEKDFSGSGNGDKVGHGTHCAGTIFGRDVNNTRIGIARGVKKVLIGKVLGDNGGGSSDMIFRGIQWALDEGASMSLGFDFPVAVKRMEQSGLPTEAAVSNALEAYRSNLRFFDALMQMVKAAAAFRDTAVVVAAAGNESDRNGNPPEEEFVFGAFTSPQLKVATQVSIRSIEVCSGISFGKLASVDPLAGSDEGLGVGTRVTLEALEQIRFVR